MSILLSPKYSKYQDYEKKVTIRTGIDELLPYEVTLPDAPKPEQFVNFGLPIEQQFFKPEHIPAWVWQLTRMSKQKIKMRDRREEAIQLAQRNDEYANFIAQQWYKRINGIFIYIYGRPTYIPGSFWWYLSYYHMDVGLPDFRFVDLDYWYWWKYCVEEDDNVYGGDEFTMRRDGKSFRGCSNILEATTRNEFFNSGLQSKTNEDAKDLFQRGIVLPWHRLPFYFSPKYDSKSYPVKEINFRDKFSDVMVEDFEAIETITTEELNSWIEARATVYTAFDGVKLKRYLFDEAGKCLAKGTPVVKFDGTIVPVETIAKGDLLMGDDSKPRMVKAISRGQEMMYRIVPKSGMEWGCNESHLLSLKWCNSQWKFRGKTKGEVVTISVKDYVQLNRHEKQHLMLYRTGIEFDEKDTAIPPYLLGLWLGDGGTHDSKITAIEPEIIGYLKGYVDSCGLKLLKDVRSENSVTWRITTGQINSKNNHVLNFLRASNLICNKHIPHDYLCNSRQKRLELLAGIIDTDGSKDKRKNAYEVTQKNEKLARNIQQLAQSIGFKATLTSRIATLKRQNKSTYRCKVYRIGIYGNLLHEIPCLVERKKSKQNANTNRNPLHSGFSVVPVGIGDYYGFTIDGNKLFLLGDYTVTHNTEEMLATQAWRVHKQCLRVRNKIIGKALLTTTIEETTKGGLKEFKKIWQQSDRRKTNRLGQTNSGLIPFFKPAWETFVFDQYGYSIIDEPLPHQAEWRKKNGDKDWDKGGRELVDIEINTEQDPVERQKIIRMYPRTIREAMRADVKDCEFNVSVINERLDDFLYGNDEVEQGNLKWENDERDTKVVWELTENGRWLFTKELLPYLIANANNVTSRNNLPYPGNIELGSIGADPYKFNITEQSRKSLGTAHAYINMILEIDQDREPGGKHGKGSTCLTDDIFMEYGHRHFDKRRYGEDMIMTCHFLGMQIFPEINVPFIWDYFVERGYEYFLKYRKMIKRRQNSHGVKVEESKTPGMNTLGDAIKEPLFSHVSSYIEQKGMRCKFPNFLEDCKDVEYKDMNPYDYFVSGAYAIYSSKPIGRPKREAEKPQSFDGLWTPNVV